MDDFHLGWGSQPCLHQSPGCTPSRPSLNSQNFFSGSVTSAMASGGLLALDPQEVDSIFLCTLTAPVLRLLALLWAVATALALYWWCVVFCLKPLEFPWSRLNSTWSSGILSSFAPIFCYFFRHLPLLAVPWISWRSFHSGWIPLPPSRMGTAVTSKAQAIVLFSLL